MSFMGAGLEVFGPGFLQEYDVAKNRQKSEMAYDQVLSEICSGRYRVGDALLPLRELSQRLGLTPFALRAALTQLESEGFIERRHGSGNYVKDLRPSTSIDQAVALCMDMRGHVFDELSRKLISGMQAMRRPVLPVDLSLESCSSMLLSTIRANPRMIVLQGNVSLPKDVVNQTPEGIAVVMLFNQISKLKRRVDWRVEIDHHRGAQIAAEALWCQGHRRVLVIGPSNAVATTLPDAWCPSVAWPGPAFIQHWQNLGGQIHRLPCEWNASRKGHLAIEYEAFRKALRDGKHQATAVFASRDVDVFDLQSILAERDATALKNLGWFGYGDTPWRQFSPAPMGSINWRLDAMTQCVCRLSSLPRHELDGGKDMVDPMLATMPHLNRFSFETEWAADAMSTVNDRDSLSK